MDNYTPDQQKKLLRELRDRSGISIIKCKQALVENKWDINKAANKLKEVFKEFALKKAKVSTDSGLVIIKTIDNNIYYSVLRCQTDSIPQTPEFSQLANQIIDKHYQNHNYQELIDKAISNFSSNITVDNIKHINNVNTHYYIHNKLSNNTGTRAAIVTLSQPDKTLAENIAMHIVFHQTSDLQELLKQKFIKNTKQTIQTLLHKNTIENFIYLSL